MLFRSTWYLNNGDVSPRVPRSAHLSLGPVQTFPTKDGWIFIMCMTQKFWLELVKAMGRDDLVDDPRFPDPGARAKNRAALDDALDPTIGFGNDKIDIGNLNASRFCFENQMSSLLDEELALLRGVDQSLGRPVYNRLFWNFTKGEGEVAYALNYSIKDVNNDGFIDEKDAMKLYPMGHGDAWGHYLNAMRKRYDLLTSPTFSWEARSEYYNLLDVVLGTAPQDLKYRGESTRWRQC